MEKTKTVDECCKNCADNSDCKAWGAQLLFSSTLLRRLPFRDAALHWLALSSTNQVNRLRRLEPVEQRVLREGQLRAPPGRYLPRHPLPLLRQDAKQGRRQLVERRRRCRRSGSARRRRQEPSDDRQPTGVHYGIRGLRLGPCRRPVSQPSFAVFSRVSR